MDAVYQGDAMKQAERRLLTQVLFVLGLGALAGVWLGLLVIKLIGVN